MRPASSSARIAPRVAESTRFAQPAILCASLAMWSRLRDHVSPVALAGHSLGEFSALAAAGAPSDHDALRLVVLRGHHMDASGEASGGGTMLALMGASPEQYAKLAARHGVSVANDNAPGQVVLSGAPDALDAVREDAEAEGLRALPLGVAGAFHSPQMQRAVARFRVALCEVVFETPQIPVISCASATLFADPVTELAEALISPVRWRDTMTTLNSLGVDQYAADPLADADRRHHRLRRRPAHDGRRQRSYVDAVLVAIEQDAHRGCLDAWRLPAYPRDHRARTANVRRVQLPAAHEPAPTPTHVLHEAPETHS